MHRVAHVFCGQPRAFCLHVSRRSPQCSRFEDFFCAQRFGAFFRKILTGFSTKSVDKFRSFLSEPDPRHVRAIGEARSDAAVSMLLWPVCPAVVGGMSCRRSRDPAAGFPMHGPFAGHTGCRPKPRGHPPFDVDFVSVTT